MRDLILTGLILGTVPFILRRPWIGVLMYLWVSVAAPHKLTWGFAFNFPFAQIIALATLMGLVISPDPKRFPVNGTTVCIFLLCIVLTASNFLALEPVQSQPEWEQMMKTMLMVLVALTLLHTRRHVDLLVWTLVISIGFYSFKGGIFTGLTGGQWRVYGPWGGVIQENNALAVATITTIPLMRYLQLQATNKWIKRGLLLLMAVSAVSALGSQSRGALLAICAMSLFLWWKSRHKVALGALIIVMAAVGGAVMSERWEERMRTIQTYQEDESAMSRLVAWETMLNIAKDRPFVGGGFMVSTRRVYLVYSADPTKDYHPVAHSIYFQFLGNHGFLGLSLFLMIGLLTWRGGTRLKRLARGREDLKWANDLGGMVQVSMIGFGIGGAFLSLGYFDLPYYLSVIVVTALGVVSAQVKSRATSAHSPRAVRTTPQGGQGVTPPGARRSGTCSG